MKTGGDSQGSHATPTVVGGQTGLQAHRRDLAQVCKLAPWQWVGARRRKT